MYHSHTQLQSARWCQWKQLFQLFYNGLQHKSHRHSSCCLFDSGSTRFTRVVFYFSIITISLPPFLMCMHTVTNSPSHRLQLSDLMMMILKQLSCLFRQAQPSSVGGLTRNQTPHCYGDRRVSYHHVTSTQTKLWYSLLPVGTYTFTRTKKQNNSEDRKYL